LALFLAIEFVDSHFLLSTFILFPQLFVMSRHIYFTFSNFQIIDKTFCNLNFLTGKMSGYENVVGGKLKLKGKALDVKAGGVKKKKKNKKHQDQISEVTENELTAGWLFFSISITLVRYCYFIF